MDRLVEYYNKYKKKRNLKEYYEWLSDVEIPEQMDSLTFLKGFCKWLVDNDKIDFEKTRDKKFIWIDFDLVEGLDGYEITYTDVFLMLLSIQDNPIEFLVSILK